MKIKDIAAGGQSFDRELAPEAVRGLLCASSVEMAGDDAGATLSLRIEHVDDVGTSAASASGVVARGRINGHFHVACARCLGPARIEVREDALIATYLSEEAVAEASADEDVELTAEDLDTYTHDGDEIDLEPLVREQLVLAIPIAALCDEECRGLCAGCGANLNEVECSCEEPVAEDSPWVAALKGIKQNMS